MHHKKAKYLCSYFYVSESEGVQYSKTSSFSYSNVDGVQHKEEHDEEKGITFMFDFKYFGRKTRKYVLILRVYLDN